MAAVTITEQLTATIGAQLDLAASWLGELRDAHGRWITGPEHNDKLLNAATGRTARAVRVHDVVLYGKTEPRPDGWGVQTRMVPMEVTGLHHHWEGSGKTRTGTSRRHRYTDWVLSDPETGEEHQESVKDGSQVKLFPREAVKALGGTPKAAPPADDHAAFWAKANRPPAPVKPPPAVTQAAPPGAASMAEADEAERQANDIKMLGQMGGRSTQVTVIKKKSLADLQAADYGFQQQAAEKGHPGKVLVPHQMVRDEIAARGGALADLTAPVRVQGAAEIAQRAKHALILAWTSSFRYKVHVSGPGDRKDKRTIDFAAEMHRLLSTNRPPKVCGPGCQDAHKFLGMVDAEATAQPGELQRGVELSPAAAARMFTPGKTIDLPIASWTNDPEVGASYAQGEGTPGTVKVLIHAAPGAKGMDISALSLWHGSASGVGGENETVTGGRMNVGRVETVNGVMNVYLTQQDFSAH